MEKQLVRTAAFFWKSYLFTNNCQTMSEARNFKKLKKEIIAAVPNCWNKCAVAPPLKSEIKTDVVAKSCSSIITQLLAV